MVPLDTFELFVVILWSSTCLGWSRGTENMWFVIYFEMIWAYHSQDCRPHADMFIKNQWVCRSHIHYLQLCHQCCQGSLSHVIWEFITPNGTKYILLDGFHWVHNDSLLTLREIISLFENEVSDIGNCLEMFFLTTKLIRSLQKNQKRSEKHQNASDA